MLYTNEVLESKRRAQHELARMAEEKGMDYCDFIHQYAKEIDKENGVTPKVVTGMEVAQLNRAALEESLT